MWPCNRWAAWAGETGEDWVGVLVDNQNLPRGRFILLGASNLARGLSPVVAAACRAWGHPLDILAAIGHGRSYGNRSRVLGRSLPGILPCGLWRALAQRDPAPSVALVTDVGNDIFYGVPVPQIAGWVGECIDRLQGAGAQVVVTALPVCNLDRVSSAHYAIMRRLIFPSCRLTLAGVKDCARELNDLVVRVAQSRGATLVEPQAAWYGFDPIHIRWSQQSTAWSAILSTAQDVAFAAPSPGIVLPRWINLMKLAPEQRWLLRFEQRRAQPCARLVGGSPLSLY
jgi:hypothetical protein